MASIEMSHELKSHLEQAARERGCDPADLIAHLLDSSKDLLPATEPLLLFLSSAEFRAKLADPGRYLAILGWVATNQRSDFADFVSHLGSRRRYLGFSPEQIRETCRHNQARQIPGTKYWAIMNINTAKRRRLLRHLLVFVGASDDVISRVTAVIGRSSVA